MSPPSPEIRKLAAIMFTDMVGYSSLAQKNEALALELLEEHRRIVREILPAFEGAEIKTMGDAFLVDFASAVKAVQCAIEIQKKLADRNSKEAPERTINIRIGIHVGDVVRNAQDVFGDGVNIAARIEPLAEPGGICISEDVARQIHNKIDHSMVRIGRGELKNINLPVVIYKLVVGSARGSFEDIPSVLSQRLTPYVLPAAVALLVLLLGASTIWWAIAKAGSRKVPDYASVAVLPFANMSSEKDNETLCDGLTEEIIGSLARVKGLRVPARSAVFAYKGKNEDPSRIGRDLKVRLLLEGSVRKSGNQLRIAVQLINVADGYQVWSQTYDRPSTEAFAIQTEIAQQVIHSTQDQFGIIEDTGGLTALQATITRHTKPNHKAP